MGGARSAAAVSPAGTVPLVGRHHELETIDELLRDGTRLITITGRGGVGKTRLALEAVSRVAPRRQMVFVALAAVEHPEGLLAAIAAAAGIAASPGASAAALLAAQVGAASVLVLDGCERTPDAGPVIRELLDEVPGLAVIATSQRPLRVLAEQVVRLGPLPVPDVGEADLERLATNPSVALYRASARAVDHRFELTAGNAPAVCELCRRLDGLPLALELAGSRAATLPVEELVRRPDGGLLDLLRRPRDHGSDYDGLRTALQSTVGLLHTRELELLGRLSVLPGPFGLDVALGAVDSPGAEADVVDDLSTLVDLHLLDPLDGAAGRRFLMPTTVRTYVRERIAADGSVRAFRAACTDWFARMAWQAANAPDRAAADDGAAWVDAEHHLLEDALRDSLDRGLAEDAARLVAGLAPYWDRRGYNAAAHRLVQRTLELNEPIESRAALQALTWSVLLGLHDVRDEPSVVASRVDRALASAAAIGDEIEELRALSAQGLLAPYTGDSAAARTSASRGLELARHGGHEDWQARFEVWAGMVAHQAGELDRAVELGRAGVERARRLGDDRTVVSAALLLLPLVGTDRRPGDPSVEEALAAARRAGALHLELALLPQRTALALRAGDVAAASHSARDALATARASPSDTATGFNLMLAAFVLEAIGEARQVARIHGALYSQLPVLEGYLPRSRERQYDEMIERARRGLGARVFDAAAAEGSAISIIRCIDETLACLPADAVGRDVDPDRVIRSNATLADAAPIHRLTARERDVLELIVAGRTNREIAAELALSPKTVMHHTGAIYRKLGVRGRSEAITHALRTGGL